MNRFPLVRLLFASMLALGFLSPTLLPASAQDTVGSSASNPVPLESPAQVGDYEITVLNVMPDAADFILAYNEFNAEPEPGTQFFLARIQVTYIGETSGSPWLDLTLNAVGADPEVPYTEYEYSCGDIPESGSFVSSELFTGGTVEYNICWAVDETDASSLVLNAASYFSSSSDQEVWFSLGNAPLATPEPGTGLKTTPETLTSSRTEPIPVGTATLVGTHTVEVVAVEPDAADAIVGSDSFNEPPTEGNQFYMVTVSVTNEGEEVSSPWFELNFKAVGDLSVGYSEFGNSCGYIPESGMDVSDLEPGESVEFNVCWQVPAAESGSLVMYVDPNFAIDNESRAWFDIQP